MNSIRSDKLKSILNRSIIYLLIIYTFFMLGRAIWMNYQLKIETKTIEDGIVKIQKQNQDLSNLILYYQTDSFKEVEARKKLGLKKPGEKVVSIQLKDTTNNFQTETAQDQANVSETPQVTEESNTQLWWRFFIK